jgi:hypothetical protein
MQVAPLLTSELWLGLADVVIGYLVAHNVLTAELGTLAKAFIVATLPVLFQTIFRKIRIGVSPFTQPTPK